MDCKHKRLKCVGRIETFARPHARRPVESFLSFMHVCNRCGDTRLDRDLIEFSDLKPGYYRVELPDEVVAELLSEEA
jgi:hypothetical protein